MSSKRRPRLVTSLSLGVLTFSAIHVAGLWAGINLPDLPLTVPRSYLLIKNGFWAVIGVFAAIALFTGRQWAIRFTRWSAVLFGIWYWIDRVFIMHSDFTRRSWPMAAIVTGAILVVLFGITSRVSVRNYYLESKA
ncbi:MAG: hypothetical protein GTO14_01355 [Anaerolineales bacterium]|nr:hypothetical protein [Anaerolineales bacterium]